VNIAAGLIHDPAVIVMDEPTAGVDIKSRAEITGFIGELGAAGKTVVYSSHSTGEIERLCARVILLHEGRLRFDGLLTEAAAEAARRRPEETRDALPRLDESLALLGGW